MTDFPRGAIEEVDCISHGSCPIKPAEVGGSAPLNQSNDGEVGDIRGDDAENSASIERGKIQATVAVNLTEHKERDEEATQDEKDIDSERAEGLCELFERLNGEVLGLTPVCEKDKANRE